jgi:hypothetical protein
MREAELHRDQLEPADRAELRLALLRLSSQSRSSGRYSKCIVSKCSHLPPQMKRYFSKICTISKGRRFR